ncbi:LacI family DNA-binding transcriptional regulator [Leifsonia sp. 2MCAF36]|uniref:LacI family DNA-binding transcriptional regulator n=1 Tax=Leifsonia sp. 2MCAF36 TaxID=3232988 RepID=UPI003F9AF8F6
MENNPSTAARRITATEVAQRAGVSISTVSKALSGRGSVRLDTRQRILEVAADLGYRAPHTEPGPAAFAPGPTGAVGVIIEDQFGRLTVPVLQGVIELFAERDTALLLVDGRGDPIREAHYVDSFLRRGVDGILVVGAGVYPREPLRAAPGVPVVYALSWSSGPDDVSISVDDAEGARMAARHLVSTGRMRLAFISGPQRDTASTTRLASTQAVLAEAGGELVHEPLFGQWTERWGRQAVGQLLRSGAQFDGIVCGSDQIARGALEALREAEVRVPHDVAVTGFDNWDVMVEASRPPLTTVDMSLAEVGRHAARTLLDAVEDPVAPRLERVECQLVPRESTALD